MEIDKDIMNSVGQLAHDLRSPLTAILASLALIQRTEAVSDTVVELADEAREAAECIEALLRRTLAQDYRARPIAVGQLTENVSKMARARLRGARRQFGVRCPSPGDRVEVETCPELVSRILDNLLTNAIRATEEDGYVGLSIEVADAGIKLGVEDDGPGFEQSAKSYAAGGSGLGLDFCRRTARRLGGALVVERSARLTRVSLWLPTSSARFESAAQEGV